MRCILPQFAWGQAPGVVESISATSGEPWKTSHSVKDLGKAARGAGLATPVAAAAEQLFLLGQAQGLAEEDDSQVLRVLAPEAD